MIRNPLRVDVTDHSLMGVSLLRLKEHLRVLDDDEDDIYTQYIQAATSYAEIWMGRFVMPAKVEAIFNSCCTCSYYKLTVRPFHSIISVEVLQDGVYTTLTSSQYVVTKKTWETLVCISDEIDIDCTIENGCQLNPETVKITYQAGDYREVNVTSITAAGQIGTATSDAPHGMKSGDQVIHSDTGEDVFDGVFGVTVTGPDTYTFIFVGTPAGSVATGLVTIPEIPPQIELGIMQMCAKMIANKGDCSDKCGDVPCSAQSKMRQFRRYIFRGAGKTDDCCCW